MNYIKNTIFWALCFALVVIQNSKADRVLKFPRVQQEKSNWCWAACSQWIMGFHGVHRTQTEIAKYGFTDGEPRDQWNWIYTDSDKGAAISTNTAWEPDSWDPGSWDPGNFTMPANKTVYGRGINIILGHFGVSWKVKGNANNPANYTLTENEFKNEIESGHPFVVRWAWSSGGGHFVVAFGYTTAGNERLCWIMNPLGEDGIQIYNYDWVMDNTRGSGARLTHKWDYTLQTTRIDTVPELTTQFPSNVKPGESVSLKLVSVLNGRDVSKSTFFKSLTEGVAIDSTTRVMTWKQTENGPTSIKFIREFGNAIDTVTKTIGSNTVSLKTDHNGLDAGIRTTSSDYKVILSVPATKNAVTSIQLYSTSGRMVFNKRFEGAGPHSYTFHRNEFGQGVYLIKALSGNQSVTKRLVF